jgi:hypothetical protein
LPFGGDVPLARRFGSPAAARETDIALSSAHRYRNCELRPRKIAPGFSVLRAGHERGFRMNARLMYVFVVFGAILLALFNGGFSTSP